MVGSIPHNSRQHQPVAFSKREHHHRHSIELSVALQVLRPDGAEVSLPQTDGSVAVALVCVAFRAGAEVHAQHRHCHTSH